jgi:pyruvate dehydrogenase E2 component (dihydrolipoamide acetyltransferase)
MRKVIAKRLTESKTQIPHVYITEEINIDKLVQFKQQLACTNPQTLITLQIKRTNRILLSVTEITNVVANVKVSVNDFIIKAAGLALNKVPQLNSFWDSQREEAIPYRSIDIAVAVALDSGLITPIIKDVNNKSLQKINEEMKVHKFQKLQM